MDQDNKQKIWSERDHNTLFLFVDIWYWTLSKWYSMHVLYTQKHRYERKITIQSILYKHKWSKKTTRFTKTQNVIVCSVNVYYIHSMKAG